MTNSRFSFFDKDGSLVSENPQTVQRQATKGEDDENQQPDQLRYRCNQLNVTRVEDKVISHATTKKEYLFKRKPDQPTVVGVTLTDYFYEVQPAEFTVALDAMKDLEYIKENVQFRLNNRNEIAEVLNVAEIHNKWEVFKDKLTRTQFYNDIKAKSEKGASDLINAGNLEFRDQENLKQTYDKVMFYHILFNDFRNVSDDPSQILQFNSQIFVKIPVGLELTHSLVSEDDNQIIIHTHGELMKDGLDETEMENQYDFYYKPFVKYGYTQYFYAYDITRKIDKQTGAITEAKALLTEGVKNNYETTTECSLKQVKL